MTISEEICGYLGRLEQQSVPMPLNPDTQVVLHATPDGVVTIESIDGDQFLMPLAYLDQQQLANLSYSDGILTIDLPTGTRCYRPVCLWEYGLSVLFTRTIPLETP